MTSYQYRKSHCGDKTNLWPSYLHSGSSYTGKTTSLYWIRALVSFWRTIIYTTYQYIYTKMWLMSRCIFSVGVLMKRSLFVHTLKNIVDAGHIFFSYSSKIQLFWSIIFINHDIKTICFVRVHVWPTPNDYGGGVVLRHADINQIEVV